MIMSSRKKVRIPKAFSTNLYEDGGELRRGPWTFEEDNLLIQYITSHGEGQWNSVAKRAGLSRTGKSCRLRWLNYLKPDIKRGNLTPHEQLLILELHSRWGNRWSKIAQHLPGRTDNEIKNYWRTRVQKQARQLKVDPTSKKFLETIRMYWMPRLLEKMEQDSSPVTSSPSSSSITSLETQNLTAPPPLVNKPHPTFPKPDNNSTTREISACIPTPAAAETCDNFFSSKLLEDECYHVDVAGYGMQELESHQGVSLPQCLAADFDWFGQQFGSSFWNSDELWQFRKAEEAGVLN